MIHVVLRKFRSLVSHVFAKLLTFKRYISVIGNPSIKIDKNCQFGLFSKLAATDGGLILLGRNVCLADRTHIVSHGGRITIEDNVFIGAGSMVVCREDVFIGRDTLIAEYVVIRDQDHRTDARPLSQSGFLTKPIHIGRDVWIGCKASILRGASVGDRSVVGAHSLVRSKIPPNSLAVGAPARVVRRIDSGQ